MTRGPRSQDVSVPKFEIRSLLMINFFFFNIERAATRRFPVGLNGKKLKLKICHEVSVGKEKFPFSSMCVSIALATSVF